MAVPLRSVQTIALVILIYVGKVIESLEAAGKEGVCLSLIVYEADASELAVELRVTSIEVKVEGVTICIVIPEVSC